MSSVTMSLEVCPDCQPSASTSGLQMRTMAVPGGRTFPARYTNTCWSLTAPDADVKVGGAYEPGEGKIKQTSTFVSQKGEADDIRKQNYQESLDWYAGIVADVFG